jgi:hypothetical protein
MGPIPEIKKEQDDENDWVGGGEIEPVDMTDVKPE